MSWEFVKIGDICKTGAGGTPLKSKKEFYIGGTIPWLLSGEVAQGEIFSSKKFITKEGLENSSAKLFPINTVLVAMYGATAGQVGILRFEAATNQAVCGIYPNDRFLPEFVYYSILFKQKELIGKATGNAQPNISQIKIKNTEIPLISIEEQKRIVAILDEAFTGIDTAMANTEKNLANARELFESYLNSVFANNDEKWEKSRFGDVCNFVRGPFGGSLKKSCFVPEGYAVYEQQHAINDQFTSVRYFVDEEKFNEMQRFELFPGDLIMSCSGTMGKVAIAPKGAKKGIINQALLKLTPSNNFEAQFLKFWMESESFLDQIEKYSQGAAIKNVASVKLLKEISVPAPELPRQKDIVERLLEYRSKTNELLNIYQRKLNALKELKQSLLQKAFSGELTAEQNKFMDEAMA